MMHSHAIPENKTGKKTDLFADRISGSAEDAKILFSRTCQRLLNPALWSALAGKEKAGFSLVDSNGYPINRLLREGDRLRIDLPGPGTRAGSGYDWVEIFKIDHQRSGDGSEELLAILMRPCDAIHPSDKPAHFFTTEASSAIVAHRINEKIITSHHGRNEVINNHTDNAVDNIRNTLVAAGAKWGLSELQWTALIKGLLED